MSAKNDYMPAHRHEYVRTDVAKPNVGSIEREVRKQDVIRSGPTQATHVALWGGEDPGQLPL